MKKFTAVLAIALTLIMLVSALPASAAGDLNVEPIDEYDDYGYYAYFDFENYDASVNHLTYMRTTTSTNKDGKLCNPFGFLMSGQGDANGTRALKTEADGNKYYSLVQTQTSDGAYGVMAVFAMQSSIDAKNCIITDSAEVSFRFRMHETQPETATGIMRLINLRRGSASGNLNFVGADTDGNIYARIGGSLTKVYTNTDNTEFLDISFRWYDSTSTYSLYVNGDPVVEAMSMGVTNSSGHSYRDGNYVKRTYNDDFIVSSRTVVGTSSGHTRAIELCRGDDKQYGFDIDDIKLKRIESAQRGAIYYENSFDAENDGLKRRVSLVAGDESYSLNNSANITFTDGVINMPGGSNFAIRDFTYNLFAEGNLVIEAKVKAVPTHTTGYQPLFSLYDGINYYNMLSVDASGNLYLEKNAPATLIAGYKLDGENWLDISVVAVKNAENAGKFGTFGAGKTASTKNCSYYFSYYINGTYVGSTKDYTIQEWKLTDEAAGTGRTLSNKNITITHTEVTGTENAALDVSGLTTVADGVNSTVLMTDENHIIYKSADGNTYYDVEYSTDKTTQLRYSTMVLSGAANNASYIRFFGEAVFDGSMDDVRVYRGTCPDWYYTNINSEKGGNIVNADFSKIGLSGNSCKAQTTSAADVNTTGVFITHTLTNNKLVRKTANGTAITVDNVLDTEYATLTLNHENWFDYYLPSPSVKNGVREAEYSFEVTLKNVAITAGTGENQKAYSGILHLFRQRIEDVNPSTSKVTAYSSGDLFAIDADNNLWGGDYSQLGSDKRFPLYDAEGSMISIDNSKWYTLRADVHCVDNGSNSKATVSYYCNGEPLYLADGSVASEIYLDRTSNVFEEHWGNPNYRVRFTQMMGGDSVTMDIKSIKISANNIEKPSYTDVSGDLVEINDNVSVFELTVPKYTISGSDKSYDVLNLVKRVDTTDNTLGLVSVNEGNGQLFVSSNSGSHQLCYADGSTVALGEEALNVTVVYNDINGKARYYVNEDLAYISLDGELIPAVDLAVADMSFVNLTGNITSKYQLFGGYSYAPASGYAVKAHTVVDSDAAEIIGFQENTVDNGVRIIAGVDTLYYSKVGFEVEIFEGGVSKGNTDVSDSVVFESIIANEETITAESKGYNYLATLVISDLPETIPENSYIIVRSYTDVAGTKHYDRSSKIAVSDEGYEFVITTDKDIYKKKQSVLLIGQSNMAGRGDLSIVEAISDPKITMLRPSGDSYAWVPMVEPIHTDKTSAGAGIAASFAKAFVEQFDQEIGLIPAAVGGTSLAKWTKGYSGDGDLDLYEIAVAKAKAAQEDSEICAILWHQGCSNTSTTNYDEQLKVILDDFIADLGLDPEKIVIVTGELARAKGSTADNVNNGLQRLVGVYPNYAVATSENLITHDANTHFDSPSLRVFGYRYFAHFYKMITGKTYEFVDDIEHYRITPPEAEESTKPNDGISYVAYEDFNNLTAGTKYTSTTTIGDLELVPGGDSIDVIEEAGNTDNKYIGANWTPSYQGYVDATTVYEVGSVIVTEAKFMMNDGFKATIPLFKLGETKDGTTTTIHLVRIASDGTLYNVTSSNGRGDALVNPANSMPYTLDKFEWTTIKVVADLANNTKDIYIDGTLCLDNAPLTSSVEKSSAFEVSFTRVFQFEKYTGTDTRSGTLYVDDFKSYRDAIVSESFDGFTTGDGISGTTTGAFHFSTAANKARAFVVEDTDGKYVEFRSLASSNSNGYMDATNPSEAGKDFTVEARLKISKYDGNDYAACGDLLKLLDPSAKSIALIRLDSDGTLKNFYYSGTSTSPTTGDSLGVKLSETEWTTVKVVCHMTENTKDIYINGTLVLEGAALYNTGGTATYVPNKTRIIQFKSSGIGTVCIDDFKAYN